MNDSIINKTCASCIWFINYECANPQVYANVDVYHVESRTRMSNYKLIPQDWFGCEFHCDIEDEEKIE